MVKLYKNRKRVNNIYSKIKSDGVLAKSIFSGRQSKMTQDVDKKLKMIKKNRGLLYGVDIKMLT